jgi:hypothetical protein
MYFMYAQIAFGMWAVWFAYFQEPIIKAFKARIEQDNPWSKPFHSRGALVSCFVATLIGLAFFALTKDWLSDLFLAPLFYFQYKILFDGVIGKKVYNNFFYLGTTAKQDIWENEKFHRNAGKVKVFFCLASFITVNIIKYFMK